ncbi:MAG TPA: hypothetical protein VG122_23895 [Gemmata sp.]|nr:hypothetical protein [Gemmata sp.]
MARETKRRNIILGSIVMTLCGVVFLAPVVYRAMQGEPFSWTPGLYAAIGFFLGAVVNLVVNRRSVGSSAPPSD